MDCTHPIQVAGLCALCGKEIDEDTFGQPTFATLHSSANVKVSREEAIRMDTEDTRHLMEQRKLALIVDLDQTIIHVTVDPTVKEWAHDKHNPNWPALKDVVAFQLGPDGKTVSHQPEHLDEHRVKNFATDGDENGCWYYVKLRPGLRDFLHAVAQRYELHVYTMGTRSYADCICRIVDPNGHLFGARILSRDENGSDIQKSLSRLFPISTDMVVIIDDRADVWSWSPNLIKVEPFEFFVGIGDINATHLGPTKSFVPTASQDASAQPSNGDKTETAVSDEEQQRQIVEQSASRPLQRAVQEKQERKESEATEFETALIQPELVLTNDDTELELIQTILLEVHQQWYDAYEQQKAQKRPDVKDVILQMKKQVLKGCVLAFSGLIPLHETPESVMIWRMAETFGARCVRTLTPDVTHLVATTALTEKAEQAYQRKNVHVVWPSWLNDSICRWVRQGETAYLIPPDTQTSFFPEHTDSEGAETDGNNEAVNLSLSTMDWGEAEDEVDAFLDESEEEEADVNEEPDEQTGKQSVQDSDFERNDDGSRTPLTDLMAEHDDMLLSPLSKRRKIAAERGGHSKLRQTILAGDETEEQGEELDDQVAESEQIGVKRRRVEELKSSTQLDMLKNETRETNSPAPSEDLLDDLATEMERELDDAL